MPIVPDLAGVGPGAVASPHIPQQSEYAGWSPVIANVVYGDSVIQQVIDWYGGGASNTKPPLDLYISENGYVADPDEATNLLVASTTPGPQGPAGPTGPTGATGATGATGPAGPAGAGSGDVLGPATHAVDRIPQWQGVDNKTLKEGLPIGVGSATSILDRQSGDARYKEVADVETVALGGTGRSTLTAKALLIGNGTSAITMLAPGTANQQLRADADGDPEWFTPTSGSGSIGSVSTKSASFTFDNTYANVLIRITANSWTQTLPNANTLTTPLVSHWQNSGTGTVKLQPSTSTVDGRSYINVYPGESFVLVADGTNYYTIGRAKRVRLPDVTVGATDPSIEILSPFGDTEICNLFIDFRKITTSVSNNVVFNVKQSGAYIASSTLRYSLTTGQSISYSTGTSDILLYNAAIDDWSGMLSIFDIHDAALLSPRFDAVIYNHEGTHMRTNATQNTAAAVIDGIKFILASGTFTGGKYTTTIERV